jgi:hypothetical protein
MIAAVAAVLFLFSGSAAHAQLQAGNLFGTVVSDHGEALPGVTVTLSASGAPQIQVTDSQGQFRFLGLGPRFLPAQCRTRGLLADSTIRIW